MKIDKAELKQRIKSQLSLDLEHLSADKCSSNKVAAILVPLTKIESSWHLCFIRRAENKNDIHSGQVAFPGGRFDPQDPHLVATALREAKEEIDINADDVELIASMPHSISIGGYTVVPIIGIIPWPYTFKLQEEEVARVFSMPLDWLVDTNNFSLQESIHPITNKMMHMTTYDEYDGEVLWGLTARVTQALLKILT